MFDNFMKFRYFLVRSFLKDKNTVKINRTFSITIIMMTITMFNGAG
ncbi:hypothetical protein AC062_0498 [Pasteurellaceae bacterium NI1060]|nr:hypothetical protein AC062_0498 [Pasteurellaceae bacterium NI1060]